MSQQYSYYVLKILSLTLENPKDKLSSKFDDEKSMAGFGHVRNRYVWHHSIKTTGQILFKFLLNIAGG